jgi:ABC-type lipoprotein release transport system permease subunit
VAVISDAFWKRELGKRADVVGQTIELSGRPTTIIGVAPPRFAGTDLGATELWLPLGAMPMSVYGAGREWYRIRGVFRLRALVRIPTDDRTRATEERLTNAFRAGSVAAGYDDALPNADLRLRDMRTALEPQFRPWRLVAGLFATLGGLALSVALIGLYGVIAYGVRRRTHELGVRLALGARQLVVVKMIVAEGVLIVAMSVVVGVVGALVGARFVTDLLYDTSAADPVVLALVAMLLLAGGIVASAFPAWRASRVDPMVALRAE